MWRRRRWEVVVVVVDVGVDLDGDGDLDLDDCALTLSPRGYAIASNASYELDADVVAGEMRGWRAAKSLRKNN